MGFGKREVGTMSTAEWIRCKLIEKLDRSDLTDIQLAALAKHKGYSWGYEKEYEREYPTRPILFYHIQVPCLELRRNGWVIDRLYPAVIS